MAEEIFYLHSIQLAAHNNTMCYYWVARSREIKPLEYFSKLPFNVSAQIELLRRIEWGHLSL